MAELELNTVSEVEIFGVGLYQDTVGLAIAEITWFGEKIEIEVLINDGDDRLLGSELLAGKVLKINYRNKKVSVTKK